MTLTEKEDPPLRPTGKVLTENKRIEEMTTNKSQAAWSASI